jgi:cytoskeleton protein RodZ
MQNIGEKLEEARKRQGISIREAAEATKIRADFLIDFENNNFNQTLPDIYKRGFIKLYAKFLRLDVDKLINDFNSAQLGLLSSTHKKNLGVMEVDPNYSSHYVGGSEPEKKESKKPNTDKSLQIKIVAVFGIVTVGVILIAILISFLASNSGSYKTKENVADKQNKSAPATPPVSEETEITLIAVGDCFITVQGSSDRNIFYTNSMSAGDRIPVKVIGPVYIISDSMENIQVEKNGASYSAPGKGVGKFLLE